MTQRAAAKLAYPRAPKEPRRNRGRVTSAVSVAAAASVATLGLATLVPGGTALANDFTADQNAFTQTNLISDLSNQGAQLQDPHLQNPWGLASSPTSPLWVSENNGTDVPGGPNVVTVYSGAVGGSAVSGPKLVVTIPGGRASTGDNSSPTGQVFNPTTAFTVTSAAGSGPATFIFDSEAGQITAWNPKADPTTNGRSTAQPEFASSTAVYKGLAEATGPFGPALYATNFHDGTVDVFDTNFQQVMPSSGLFGFSDPDIPAGFAPFGIQLAPSGNLLYVTYAKQNAAKHDDVAGKGLGIVDVFTTSGVLVSRFASGHPLDAPWGVAFAPPGFGPFGGDVLIGNFGDGRINVYTDLGQLVAHLTDPAGSPITIDGLWGLRFGNSSFGGPGSLIFSGGINGENDGLLGLLTPAG